MSDSGEIVNERKQKIEDELSASCSEISNTNVESLLDETQSTDSNQSTQLPQELCEIVIETDNDQNTSNLKHMASIRADNKAAERSRLYRERHREEINKRRRYTRQCQQYLNKIQNVFKEENTEEIEDITQTTSNNQRSTNSRTLRQQRYYERHKEEINRRKRDSRRKQNPPKPIPATPAERNRNYRERNRQQINERRRKNRQRKQNIQRADTECDIDSIDAIEEIRETTPNDQQSLDSSNDAVQEMAQNYTKMLMLIMLKSIQSL